MSEKKEDKKNYYIKFIKILQINSIDSLVVAREMRGKKF